MVALRILRRSSGFVSAVILARLFAPSDYGLVAVGLLCVSLFEILTEIGVKPNLIQEPHHTSDLLATAWTFEVLRGLAIMVVMLVIAPYAAVFFREPRTTTMIMAMGCLPLVRALASIKIVYFPKELQFHKQFLYEASGAVCGVAVAIYVAVVHRTVWALFAGLFVAELVPTIVSYYIFPEWPRLCFSRKSTTSLFSFGKWVLLGGMASYVALEADKYFVGSVLGVGALGMYKMASTITNVITRELGRSVISVLFPAYSKANQDSPRLRRMFLQSYEVLLNLLAPACVGLFLVSEDLLPLVFGNRWLGMIPILQALCVAFLVQSLAVSAGGLLLAKGKPQYLAAVELVRAFVLLVSLHCFGFSMGILGVVLALLMSNAVAFLLYLLIWSRVLDIHLIFFLRIYAVVAIAIGVMIGFVTFTQSIIHHPPLARVAITIAGGIGSYLATLFLLSMTFAVGPFTITKDWLGRRARS